MEKETLDYNNNTFRCKIDTESFVDSLNITPLEEILNNKDLRRIHTVQDVSHFYYDWNTVFDTNSNKLRVNKSHLNNMWFNQLYTTCNLNLWNSWNYFAIPSNEKPILFEYENIAILKDKIYVKASNSGPLLQGNSKEYATEGLKALKILHWNTGIPKWAVYIYGNPDIKNEINGYTINYTKGKNINISVSSSNVLDAKIPAKGYAILDKESDQVNENTIAMLTQSELQFSQLSTQGKHINLQPTTFFGIDKINFSQHGELLHWVIDQRTNFIIGIFQSWGKTSLKIIRINKEATLMAEREDLKQIMWFHDEDISCINDEGNLVILDGTFESFSQYYRGEISSDEESDVHNVAWWCDTTDELFASKQFSKALNFVLSHANTLINKHDSLNLFERIREKEIITKKEVNNLLLILTPHELNTNLIETGNDFIGKVKIVWGGNPMQEPLRKLLIEWANNPQAKIIIEKYIEHLNTYEHTRDIDSIDYYGPEIRVIKKDDQRGIVLKGIDGNNDLIKLASQEIDIIEEGNIYKITITHGNQITYMDYENGKGVTSTTSSNNLFSTTPLLNEDNIWIAQLKTGWCIFVYKEWEQLMTFDNIGESWEFSSYEKAGDGYILNLSHENDESIFVIVKWDGSCKKSEKFNQKRQTIYVADLEWGNQTLILKWEAKKEENSNHKTGNLRFIKFNQETLNLEETEIKNVLTDEVKQKDLMNFREKKSFEITCTHGKDENEKLKSHTIKLTTTWVPVLGHAFDSTYINMDNWEKVWINNDLPVLESFHNNEFKNHFTWELLYQSTQNPYTVISKDTNDWIHVRQVIDEQIKQLSLEEIVSERKLQSNSDGLIKISNKLDTNETIYLHVEFNWDTCTNILHKNYETVGKEKTYGNATYFKFKQDGKFWLLMKKNGKITVFHEASSEQQPSFWDEWFTLGSQNYILTSKNEITELKHDFEVANLIPKTTYYLVKKEKERGLAQIQWDENTLKKYSMTFKEKPDFHEGIISFQPKNDQNYHLVDLTVSSWSKMKSLSTTIVKPEHLKNGIFALQTEQWFSLIWAFNDYKVSSSWVEYKWLANAYLNGSVYNGYVNVETISGSNVFIKWIQEIHNQDSDVKELPNIIYHDNKNQYDIRSIDTIHDISHIEWGTFISCSEMWGYWLYFLSTSDNTLYRLHKEQLYNHGISYEHIVNNQVCFKLYKTDTVSFLKVREDGVLKAMQSKFAKHNIKTEKREQEWEIVYKGAFKGSPEWKMVELHHDII